MPTADLLPQPLRHTTPPPRPGTSQPAVAALPAEPAAVYLLPDRRRLLLRIALVIALLGALVLAVSALPGLGEVRARLADATPGWLALALAFEALSCLACVVVLRAVFCARLPWGLSYHMGMSAPGANALLPAGGAGGLAVVAWALRRTGMPAERIGRRAVAFFVLTSAVNFSTAVLAGGLLALGILAGGGSLAFTAVPAIAAALIVAGVVSLPRLLRSRGLTQPREGRAGRILQTVRGALNGGLRDAIALARSGNPLIVGGALGYMLFDVAALGAAFIAIGDLPPMGVLLLAYVVGQLGGLIPLPGGVGGADGGLIAALVLYGTPLANAAAAVLAYRAMQFGLPALLGAVSIARLPGAVDRLPCSAPLCEPRPAARRGGSTAPAHFPAPRGAVAG